MISVLEDLLSKQNPKQRHTLLTRLLVSLCICLAYLLLYGVYGLLAGIIVYLVGVELMGLPLQWMFYAFALGLLIGSWKAFRGLRDYWIKFGHGDS